MAMLSYNTRDLEQHAASVDGALDSDDAVWEEEDVRPVREIHVTGRLSAAGAGRFYWSGQVEGTANVVCRRCLVQTQVDVSEPVHVIFAEEGGVEGDDPDVFRLGTRTPVVDLRPAVREQWLLGVPSFAVCKEECKGLCARCGADLNAGPCSCPPETDSRWDALRSVRNEPGGRP